MARRKGGFGVLLFVSIFLGLVAAGASGGLFYFYNRYDDLNKNELPKLQDEAKKSKALSEKAVARWNELAPFVLEPKIAKPEDFDSGEGRKGVEESVLKPILSHLVKEDYRGDMQVGRGFVEHAKYRLVDVVTALDRDVETARKERDECRKSVQDLASKLKSATEAARRDTDALRQTISQLTADLNAANDRLSAAQRESDSRVSELNAKMAAADRDKIRIDRERNQENSNLRNEMQRLKEENVKLQNKGSQGSRAEVFAKDGEVIGVAQPLGIAYISIGHHQRVERGMRFKVYTLGASGIPRLKGEVEVRNVDADSSKVGILSQLNERDPILVGDIISNPLYEPDAHPVFVLCGEMERYSKEDMVRLIEENGGRVDVKVSPQTDFLVTGGSIDKYEGTANFRDAKQLGIRMMDEKELLDYLPHYGER